MLGNNISVAHLSELLQTLDARLDFTGSLARVHGSEVVFGRDVDRLSPATGWAREDGDGAEERILHFSKRGRRRTLVAVDSATALIGRTPTGLLCAIRAAAAYAEEGSRLCTLRYGPLPVHLDPATLGAFVDSRANQRGFLPVSETSVCLGVLRRKLETALWIAHAQLSDSLVLADGSLPTVEAAGPASSALQLVRRSRLVGLSKQSGLPQLGFASAALARAPAAPVFLEVSLHPSRTTCADVTVGVVKFRAPGLVLRVDLPGRPSDGGLDLLSDINQNDLFTNGYPETLRVAHHTCRFTRLEIEAMRIRLARSLGLRPVLGLDSRLAALGRW